MKRILFVAFAFICGCSTTETTTQSKVINKSDYTPPEQNELIVSGHRTVSPQPELPTEQQRYEESLRRINAAFNDEYIGYALCVVAKSKNNSTKCQMMLKDYCIKDIYLDSRGGWHKKPYCGSARCSKNEHIWCDTNVWLCGCTK